MGYRQRMQWACVEIGESETHASGKEEASGWELLAFGDKSGGFSWGYGKWAAGYSPDLLFPEQYRSILRTKGLANRAVRRNRLYTLPIRHG